MRGAATRRCCAARSPVAIFAIAIGALAVVFLRPGSASAHAVLIRSDPPAGATLQEAPKQLQLWFSEDLSRELTTVRMMDSEGRDIGPLQLTYNDADPRQITASLPDLQQGSYTVAWSSFATDDGHRLDGSLTFGVGVTPGAATAPTPDYRPTAREVAARWASLIGALGFAGAITVMFLIAAPAAADRDPRKPLMALTLAAVAVLAVGDLAALLLRAERAGGLDSSGSVLTGSAWGHLWIARMSFAAIAAAGTAATLVRLTPWFRARLAALGLIGAGVLLTESLGSHAAARTGALPVVADFVHLAASSTWIGGVLALAGLVIWSRRDPSGARRASTAGAVRRFGFIAVASIGLILLTGIYRTVQEMPTLRSFIDTTYGKALTVKLALVAVALVAGAYNFLLARRWSAAGSRRRWTLLARTIPGEALVGGAIVATVALITLATPAASLLRLSATPEPADLSGVIEDEQPAGDLLVDLRVEPASGGTQRVTATIVRNGNASSADRPLVLGQGLDIEEVRFRFTPLDQPFGESRVIADERANEGQGVFEASGAFVPFSGRWKVQVDIRRAAADDVRARFVLDTARGRGPAYVQVLPSGKLYYALARSSGDPQLVLVAADGFYRSTDGGVTWQQLPGPAAYRIIADPANQTGFIAVAGNALVRTADAGDSWTTLYRQEGEEVFDAVIDAVDPRVIVMATENGLYRSADSGATWSQRLPSAPPSVVPSQEDQWTRLAAGPDGTILAGRRPGVVVVSRDGGESWQETPATLDLPGGVMGLMVDPSDGRRWLAGAMGGGVWLTADAGASWQQAATGVSATGHGAGFDKTVGGLFVVATTGQGVLASLDGVNWTELGDARIEQGIAEGVGLATGGDGKPALLVAGLGVYRLDLSGLPPPTDNPGRPESSGG